MYADPSSLPPSFRVCLQIDLVSPKRKLLAIAENLCSIAKFKTVWMISAKGDDGVPDVREWLLDETRPGEWEFANSCVSVCLVFWYLLLLVLQHTRP